VIGSSFAGAYKHKNLRMNKEKTKASHHNPHSYQFPTYKGTDIADVDDGSTGELEGVFKGRPVLLSRFKQLPTQGIFQDLISRSDFGANFDKPALTLPPQYNVV